MMKIRQALCGILLAAGVGAVHGQILIDDGKTYNVYANTSFGTNVIMGVTNSNNGMLIYDGRTVIAPELTVGLAAGSSGNTVELLPDSTLSLSDSLYVGWYSSDNSVSASDGAVIYTPGESVIGLYGSADNNEVVIDGAGATWINQGHLYVGYRGESNRVEVLNNGVVSVAGSVFIGSDSSADNNSIVVSDSTLLANYDLVVGLQGEGNSLSLSDEAAVLSYNGYVGLTNLADNNTVMITTDAAWTNYGSLYIGSTANTGNSVTVTNGGAVVVYNGLVMNGTGNSFNLERGGALTVHDDFDASMAGFNFNEGSALYVGGALTGLGNAIEGERTLGLTGTNGWWNLSGSDLSVGSASSSNTLEITNGGRVDAGALTIGTVSNSGNQVTVDDGGMILLGGDLTIEGSGNAFTLGDGGWLVASNGLDAGQTGFSFQSGATLESHGMLTGLGDTLEDDRWVLLSGSNAVWDLGASALQLGLASSSNAVHVLDSAYLASAGALIGSGMSTGNLVYVSGDGSLWESTGDVLLDGYYNDLLIDQGGSASISGTLSVQNQSAVAFNTGGYASATDYYQDASSIFSFSSVTNSPASPALLTVADTAEFEGGATIQYTGNISGLERGIVFTNRLVSSDTLVVAGVTNASGTDLDALNISGLGSLLSINLVSTDDDLLALISRLSLSDSAGFDPGSEMAMVSDEIDTLADGGDERANNMVNVLSQMSSDQQNQQLSQLYDRHTPTYAHVNGMLEGFRQVRTRGVVPGSMLPMGPMGPHFYGRQSELWGKGYGTWGQRDGSDEYSGYDQSIYGAVIGMDRIYGELMAGVAGGMAMTEIDADDGDSSEATTGYGLFYASWGTVSWFGDLNLGYGHSGIEDRSGTAFNTSADYNADQFGFYLGGGKEMAFKDDKLFVTPSAAMSGAYYLQGGYTENSTTALPRRVDDYDYLSFRSELGLKTTYSYEFDRSVLMPEVHANWLHEFNADEERINYSLVGGTGNYSFGMQAPVEDLFELGTSLSWWTRSGRSGSRYEWALGLDGRFGDGYSETTASLRLLRQF